MRIQKNVSKIIMISAIIIAVLICCIVGLQNPTKYISALMPSKYLVIIISVCGIITISYAIVYFMKILLNKDAFFEISEKGIYNGLSFLKEKSIDWDNIKDIETIKYEGIWRIKIEVFDFSSYTKGLDFFTKLIVKNVVSKIGTSILIDSLYLKCEFEDLSNIIIQEWKIRKGNKI